MPAAAQADTPASTERLQKLAPQVTDAIAQKATENVTLGYVLTGDADDRRNQQIRPLGPVAHPGRPHRRRARRSHRRRHRQRRDLVLPGPLLAGDRERQAAAAADSGQDRRLHEARRHDHLRHPRRRHRPALGHTASKADGTCALQRLLGSLDVPRLEPVPEDHVLTKSFYLLRTFPGRWDNGRSGWKQAPGSDGDGRKARRADGVTSIMITSNDFASAWALDASGRPLYPVVPGGEDQREMALRTGINIVMHALTGNYKADQVHVPRSERCSRRLMATANDRAASPRRSNNELVDRFRAAGARPRCSGPPGLIALALTILMFVKRSRGALGAPRPRRAVRGTRQPNIARRGTRRPRQHRARCRGREHEPGASKSAPINHALSAPSSKSASAASRTWK